MYVINIRMMDANGMRMVQLRECLEQLRRDSILKPCIQDDPIEFPHLYEDPRDIELAGFIASALAFGRIGLFKPVIRKILSFSEGSLYEYVINFDPSSEAARYEGLYYRMCKGRDIACLMLILREVVRKYETIGNLFLSCQHGQAGIRQGLARFINILKETDTTPVYGKKMHTRGLLQLLPSPGNGGPCKRLNMYLRWMVRPNDGIDFGLWNRVSPSLLIIPLDVHIERICKKLNMTKRKSPSWAMAEEITNGFRLLAPEDPLKYDFALCHLGISGQWKEVLTDAA